MTTRTWAGGSGLWSVSAGWLGSGVPLPGDTEVVSGGTVSIPSSLDAATVLLGSTRPGAPAVLAAAGAVLGHNVSISSTAKAANATLSVTGSVGDFGSIEAAAGGTFTIRTTASGADPGELVLLTRGSLDVSNGDRLVLNGTLVNHGSVTVGNGSTFVNSGAVVQSDAVFVVESGGTLTGGGTFSIGLLSSLYFLAGAAPSAQAVRFTDVGGRLLLADPATYTGIISNFQAGDLIDLTATVANSASYNAASHLLTVSENGTVVARLKVVGPASGAMTATPDGNGGTLIAVPGTLPRVSYTIAGGDRAMYADQVRASMTTPIGRPITGAGIKIGIISNSFDAIPGIGAADPANAAALAGYLPLNAATGTCAVTVLSDAAGYGYDDEGRAMAEEVHQVAPGAQLYFAAVGDTVTSFAVAIASLQAAGCQVIVDDISFVQEPFFQVAGPVDSAIGKALAAGVSYFSAAGNLGDASYQAAYTPQAVTLYNGALANAELFATGTPYQTLTLLGGVTVTIALQWAAPWASNGQRVAGLLSDGLFDSNGTLVAVSRQLGATISSPGTGSEPETLLSYTPSVTGQYQLYIQGYLAAGTLFKYVLYGTAGGGSTAGGTIDDPAANNAGTVAGHAMMPGVNAVGAINFADTPAFGTGKSYAEDYSSNGPSELLFTSSGTALATPQVDNQPQFIAPDGEATSVAGFASFDGTSAAAPNAAAVAALMLQADPSLTPAQITALLKQSAVSLGLPATRQGAGLVQANKAVALALAAAGGTISAHIVVSSGHTSSDRVLGSASTETVLSGGTAVDTIVLNGGRQYVRGTASATTVSRGGGEVVSSGGTAVGTTVSSGGAQYVLGHATASGTRLKGGSEYVSSGGTAVGVAVSGGGHEFVASAGIDRLSVVSSGGLAFISSGGTISGGTVISGGTITVAAGGAVLGGLTISGGTAAVAGRVAAGQSVTFAGAGGVFVLGDRLDFAATVKGFGAADRIDLGGVAYGSGETLSFTEAAGKTSGTLSVVHGTAQANLTFAGSYTTSNFSLAGDGAGGTLVKYTG